MRRKCYQMLLVGKTIKLWSTHIKGRGGVYRGRVQTLCTLFCLIFRVNNYYLNWTNIQDVDSTTLFVFFRFKLCTHGFVCEILLHGNMSRQNIKIYSELIRGLTQRKQKMRISLKLIMITKEISRTMWLYDQLMQYITPTLFPF